MVIILIAIGLLPYNLNAQKYWCGADTTDLKPNSFSSQTRLENRTNITLPIVVHIVWNKTEENLSDTQILKQLERLNIDFNYTVASLSYIPKEFLKSVGYPTIKFCLASQDPDGKSTKGITRTQTHLPNIGTSKDILNKYAVHYDALGGKSAWNPDKYINIWIGKLENLYGRSSIGGSVALKAEDGIVLDPAVFNAMPNRNLSGRTLIHEMGHYLGLRHLWGMKVGDCDEDDEIEDTPRQSSPYFGCPRNPQKSCDANNMYMNFMDFVDDACMHFFTKDQVAKMEITLMTSRPSLMNANTATCFKDATGPILSALNLKYSKEYIQLSSPTLLNAPVQYLFCNVLGQIQYQNQIYIQRQSEIFIKDLPSGIYFLYLRYNKEHRVFKFLKS